MRKIKLTHSYVAEFLREPHLVTAEPVDNANDIGCLGRGNTKEAAAEQALARLREALSKTLPSWIVEVDW